MASPCTSINQPDTLANTNSMLVVKHTFFELVDTTASSGLQGTCRRVSSDPGLFDLCEQDRTSEPDANVNVEFNLTGLSDSETSPESTRAPTPRDDQVPLMGSGPTTSTTPSEHGSEEHGMHSEAQSSVQRPLQSREVQCSVQPEEVEEDALGRLASENARLTLENQLLRENARLALENQMLANQTRGGVLSEGSLAFASWWRRHCEQEEVASKPGDVTDKTIAEETRTTVMLRNLPNNYSRAMLLAMLGDEGFTGKYNFLYLPIDFKSRACLGYAFVNLVDTATARIFWKKFDGYSKWMLPSRKVCSVCWSGPHQGLAPHVERYRNSPVMHASVLDECKPVGQ
mmetsp:Transcript_90300/g.210123  ORF Transcript_90300/g.210123 Transcript_90300/m.210123 type:complete len:344 (-) Transcript_90300:232-1263(-)